MNSLLSFVNNINVDRLMIVVLCFCAAFSWVTCNVTCAATSIYDAVENRESAQKLCSPPELHSDTGTEL